MKRFKTEGQLWLICQEGGFASDAFMLAPLKTDPRRDADWWDKEEYLDPPLKPGSSRAYDLVELDDAVAEAFGVERQPVSANRYIGPVRITIERLEKGEL